MRSLNTLQLCLITVLLVCLPLGACASGDAVKTPAQQQAIAIMVERMDKSTEKASDFTVGSEQYKVHMLAAAEAQEIINKIEKEAEVSNVEAFLNFLPIPEPFKKPLAGIAAAAIFARFKRPREIMVDVVKGLAKSVMHITPKLGGPMSASSSIRELGKVGLNLLAGVGLLDRRPEPVVLPSDAPSTEEA